MDRSRISSKIASGEGKKPPELTEMCFYFLNHFGQIWPKKPKKSGSKLAGVSFLKGFFGRHIFLHNTNQIP